MSLVRGLYILGLYVSLMRHMLIPVSGYKVIAEAHGYQSQDVWQHSKIVGYQSMYAIDLLWLVDINQRYIVSVSVFIQDVLFYMYY